jgi:excinuclease UvrABC helicase subunit UvrB
MQTKHVSQFPFTPKLHAVITLIRDILQRREQVVVFSALHDPNDSLARLLAEAGVTYGLMDGRVSPAKRGGISKAFKRKAFPVLLCGVESCAEGHSWPQASNVILMAYSWAFDKFLQSINRVHRLNSESDVNLYNVICDGSIDRKLESNIQEKGDAAELVLDGQLLGEDPCEVNLAELLQIAQKDFANMKAAGTLDERELEKEWPATCPQLGQAMKLWSQPANVIPLPVLTNTVSPPANKAAMRTRPEWWDDLPLWRQAFRRYA